MVRNIICILLGALIIDCSGHQSEDVQSKNRSLYLLTSNDSLKNGPDISSAIDKQSDKKEPEFCNCNNKGQLIFDFFSDTAIYITRRLDGKDSVIKCIIREDREVGLRIENSQLFKYHGDSYFRTQLTLDGTGYFNSDELYFIDKEDCSLQQVKIEYSFDYYQKHLKKGEGIWKGEDRIYEDDSITGNFAIWNDSDANCCPSVGYVSVVYRIKKNYDRIVMLPDTNTFSFQKASE